jgi:hypothetical protein
MKMKQLLLFLFLCPFWVFSQAVDATFNANGVFVIPTGYTADITVKVWGGGAGGSKNVPGGGGGGGAYAEKSYTNLPSGNYTVIVGMAAAGEVNGNSSSFAGTLIANGGITSTSMTGGLGGAAGVTGGINTSGGNGGAGFSSGGDRAGGGGGGSGMNSGNGNHGLVGTAIMGGPGGVGEAVGGQGALNTSNAGTAGVPGGGGGGQGKTGGDAGTGQAGRVIVDVTSSPPLPVELVFFTAILERNQVKLNFETASELNNLYFDIEHSTDGAKFNEIGQVNGFGTTSSKQNYSFVDKKPQKGINYYRLKQVDIDGKSEYSNIISIRVGQNKNIQIAPSPAIEMMQVTFDEINENSSRYEVIDVGGRVVLSGDVDADTESLFIDVSNLMSGIYTLQVISPEENLTKLFFKK